MKSRVQVFISFLVTVKPGTCPTLPPDTFGICVDLCSEDSDCLSDQKCCSHGCGHSCSSPGKTRDQK